jgi:hypothetical protein
MEAILLLVHPNDLEKLIIQATSPQDVLDSADIKEHVWLGSAWDTLNKTLNAENAPEKSLQYVIQAEHPLSDRNIGRAVHYNTVVRVAEIHQALQSITVDAVKTHYQYLVTQTTQQAVEQELNLAELKLIYLQLQDLYRDATRQNLAVLSVIVDAIRPQKLI